jgi:hypothetical protein
VTNLKELISKIEEKRAEAAVSPEDADPRVRAGVESVVRNAKRELETLEAQYKEAVLANVVIIAIEGEGSKEFADTARIAFEVPTVNYRGAIDRVTDSVKARSSRVDFGTQEFFMVLDELNKLKLDYNFLQLPAPKVNPAIDQVYDRPVATAIENIIKTNYDEELSSAVARRDIGTLALKLKFAGKHLPVVLYGYGGSLNESLLPRPIATVSVKSDEVTKDFVKDVLTQVKTRLGGGSSRKKKADVSTEETNQQSEEQA